jgi:pimeloyl-ACP methyl ester carboxylesterase
MTLEGMTEDVAAALQALGIQQADVFGYSMGSDVALQLVIRYPRVVRKLVLGSASYTLSGVHPGLLDGLEEMKPDAMFESPWHQEYMRIAPRPEDFNRFFAKKAEMDRQFQDIPAETIRAIKAPTLIIIGDSDLIRPEHAVEMFRLLGGGVFGDTPAGMPNSQLAILPGTSHVTLVDRADWLVSMIDAFLDAPVKET